MPYLRSRRQVPTVACPCPVCGNHCSALSDDYVAHLNTFDLLKDAGLAPRGVFYCSACLLGIGSPIIFNEAYWTCLKRRQAPDGSEVSNLLKEDLFCLQDPQLAYIDYWWRCAQVGAVVGDTWRYVRCVNSRGVAPEQLHLTPDHFRHSHLSLELPYPVTDDWWVSPIGALCPGGTFSGWARFTHHWEDGELYASDDEQHADYQ
jgi:hypothetical protein